MFVHRIGNGGRGSARQRPERIARKMDGARRDIEFIDQIAKRIGGIKRQGVRAGKVRVHRRDHSSDLRQRQCLR